MMSSTRKPLCLSISALALPCLIAPVVAQPLQGEGDSLSIAEIVVTARRREESLQEVPNAINVVSADTIDKFKLTEFTDLESVVPGLSLSQDGSGTQTDTSLRGVTFDARSTAPPTVAMYLNDAPVQSLFLYDSLFDVGQIEVLRGPQGTARGVSAPSGAITVTTRKPDVDESGGFIKGLWTDRDGQNLQGGINVPVIPDKFALRLSGVADETEANGVKSINSGASPEQEVHAGRLSALFAATDNLSMEATYTRIDKTLQSFEPVSGPGQGTIAQPAIDAGQRLSLQDRISDVDVTLDAATARVEFAVAGHDLTYVGSYQEAETYALRDNDIGGILPGVTVPFLTTSGKNEKTHEIRLSSQPDSDRRLDYTFGVFFDDADTFAYVTNPGPLLPGAFGSPALPPQMHAFDPRYQIPVLVDIDYVSRETSVFASATLQIGERTELTAGLRQIWSDFSSSLDTTLGDGLVAIPPAFIGPGLPGCEFAQLDSTYGGFCDVPVPAATLPATAFDAEETPLIYNVSLSHSPNEDLMLYLTTGTAYRTPIASPGIQGELAGHPDPQLNTLTFHPKEMSTNYEAGFKWTGLDGRARLNSALYYQEFEDLTTQVPSVFYRNTATGQVSSADFTASVDAVVSGFELDTAIAIGNFDLSAQVSYANGDVDGSPIPCNIPGAGGPVFNTAGLISLCPGGSVSRDPLWGATLQGEYTVPVAGAMAFFSRALVSYKGENKNRHANFVVDDYAITSLYVGIRSEDQGWEITGFVRNLFGTERTLDASPNAYEINGSLGQSFPSLIPPGGSGYYATEVTRPREIGISFSYGWGSR